jgi:hypothetical protein
VFPSVTLAIKQHALLLQFGVSCMTRYSFFWCTLLGIIGWALGVFVAIKVLAR